MRLFDQSRGPGTWMPATAHAGLRRRACTRSAWPSPSRYHVHGAYILEHSDIAGFSQQGQRFLAALVRARIDAASPVGVRDDPRPPAGQHAPLRRPARLAVLLHRSHDNERMPVLQLRADGERLTLAFDKRWLQARPLLRADLEGEARGHAGQAYSCGSRPNSPPSNQGTPCTRTRRPTTTPQSAADKAICDLLAREIAQALPEAGTGSGTGTWCGSSTATGRRLQQAEVLHPPAVLERAIVRGSRRERRQLQGRRGALYGCAQVDVSLRRWLGKAATSVDTKNIVKRKGGWKRLNKSRGKGKAGWKRSGVRVDFRNQLLERFKIPSRKSTLTRFSRFSPLFLAPFFANALNSSCRVQGSRAGERRRCSPALPVPARPDVPAASSPSRTDRPRARHRVDRRMAAVRFHQQARLAAHHLQRRPRSSRPRGSPPCGRRRRP